MINNKTVEVCKGEFNKFCKDNNKNHKVVFIVSIICMILVTVFVIVKLWLLIVSIALIYWAISYNKQKRKKHGPK